MKSFMILVMSVVLSVFLVGCIKTKDKDKDTDTTTQQEGADEGKGTEGAAGGATQTGTGDGKDGETVGSLKNRLPEKSVVYTQNSYTVKFARAVVVLSGEAPTQVKAQLGAQGGCVTLQKAQIATLVVKEGENVACSNKSFPKCIASDSQSGRFVWTDGNKPPITPATDEQPHTGCVSLEAAS